MPPHHANVFPVPKSIGIFLNVPEELPAACAAPVNLHSWHVDPRYHRAWPPEKRWTLKPRGRWICNPVHLLVGPLPHETLLKTHKDWEEGTAFMALVV